MRLDKYLSHMGFGTRNDVKKLIKNGWVTINDETIKKADYNVKEDDRVCVDDEPVSYVEYEYYILNKPQGYVRPLKICSIRLSWNLSKAKDTICIQLEDWM